MQALRNMLFLACAAVWLLMAVAGCRSTNATATDAAMANSTSQGPLVTSPPLTRKSILGGPMPLAAQKIFAQKMQQVAEQSQAAHAAAKK